MGTRVSLGLLCAEVGKALCWAQPEQGCLLHLLTLCSDILKSTKSYLREGHLSLICTEIPDGQAETLLISDRDRMISRSQAIISCTTLGTKI